MEDQDWLDQRLAANSYLPDEGFTARVVERLPARQPSILRVRGFILATSAFLAVCLLALNVLPLFHTFQQVTAHHSIADFLLGVAALIRQPNVVIMTAGTVVVLALASIPWLRRWA